MKRTILTALVGILAVAFLTIAQVAAGQGFGDSSSSGGNAGGRGGFRQQVSDPEALDKQIAALRERFVKIDEQIQKPLPKRELTSSAGASRKIVLQRADPKLLENKFLASFSLVPAGYDLQGANSAGRGLDSMRSYQVWDNPPSDAQNLLIVATSQLGGPMVIYDSRRRSSPQPVAWNAYFQVLVDLCPPEQRPAQAVIEFLTSEAANRDVESTGFQTTGFDQQVTMSCSFWVYAPTAEQAAMRAQGIVQLLDGGMSRPMQEVLLPRGKEKLSDAEKRLAEIQTTREAIEADEKFLATPSEISPEILTQLKSQKVMIAVEEAGLAARVKACDAMLAENRKLEISTLQSVGDMKVKAEIERVGLKEKLDQINKFIGEGDERRRRAEKIVGLMETLRRQYAGFRAAADDATIFANLSERFAPFLVQGNEVSIAPIEWTAAGEE